MTNSPKSTFDSEHIYPFACVTCLTVYEVTHFNLKRYYEEWNYPDKVKVTVELIKGCPNCDMSELKEKRK